MFFSTCCLQLNCKHGRLCVHVLLGCFAERDTVGRSYLKGCSPFLVSHPLPRAFTVTGTAEAAGGMIPVCSVEVWHLSEGPYEEFFSGDRPAPYTSSVTTGSFFPVLVKRPRIDKITGKNVSMCVCKNFVHLLVLEIVSYWEMKKRCECEAPAMKNYGKIIQWSRLEEQTGELEPIPTRETPNAGFSSDTTGSVRVSVWAPPCSPPLPGFALLCAGRGMGARVRVGGAA